MSNKPRKQKKQRKPKAKARAGTGTGSGSSRGKGGALAEAVPEHRGLEIPDEYITAPKQTSKWRFLLMVALVVVLLIIFIVPGAIMGMFGGGAGGEDPVYLVWEHPTQGAQQYRYREFKFGEQRAFTFAVDVDRLLLLQLQLSDQRPTEEDVARLLVLDRLAADAGVEVTDEDLAAHLKRTIDFVYQGNAEAYKQRAAREGSVSLVEDTVRRCLRVERFLELAGFAGAVADPEEIESRWAEDRVEFAFDYVALAAADFEDAARAELPEDAELSSWFDDRPEAERDALRTPERRRASFVRFRDAETTPAAALVSAFPEEEGAEAEERAQTYYNRVFFKRFVRPEGPEGEEDADASDFLSFDEVRERCLAEAPVYFAMTRWLADLRARQEAGEAIDLAAEAALYGLETTEMEAPLSRAELRDDEEYGDDALVAAVFQADPEVFASTVVVSAKDLSIVRGIERIEPALPPFEEVRDQVADLWVEPRARELAEERLRSLWEGFEEVTPDEPEDEDVFPPAPQAPRRRATQEAFAAAASEAGLELYRRDWLDKGGEAEADPEYDEPAHRFLWRQRALYSLDVDDVAEPAVDEAEGTAYLVRVAGKREVPIERMTPREYEQYKTRARTIATRDVARGFDIAFLEERYGLAFARSSEEEAEREADRSQPPAEE